MSTLTTEKDLDQLTLTFVAEFDAPPSRVWQIWEDPRQLERWWGPPTLPATFTRHDLSTGSESAYFMTGADGERAHGWWEITSVAAPDTFSYDDGFADEHGGHQEGLGVVHATVTLEAVGSGTRMIIENRFESVEHLEELLAMGMEAGMAQAMTQIDDVLAR